jgi:hypothetical protein
MNRFEPKRTLRAIVRSWRATGPSTCLPPDAPLWQVDPVVARDIAQWFLAAPARSGERVVTDAYRELQEQNDRQFAELTDPDGALRYTVAWTRQPVPYSDAAELIDAVRTTRQFPEHKAVLLPRRLFRRCRDSGRLSVTS